MNILFVTRDFLPAPGGIAIFIHNLAHQLGGRGHNILIIAPRSPGCEQVKKGNYTVIWCPVRKYLSSLPFVFHTLRLANNSKPEIIFLGHFMSTHGLGALIAKRLLGVPYVFLTHGNDLVYSVSTKIDEHVALNILDHTSLGLCNSRHTQGELIRKGYRGPTNILHPGVDPQIFRPDLETAELIDMYCLRGKKVLLSVSRLVEKKNIDGVLRALPLVIEQVPNLLYLVVGAGPMRGQLEALAFDLGISRHVRFLGSISNEHLPRLYCASDLYVMPSHSDGKKRDFETFGISFIEASACARPAVGSTFAGAAEAVIDEVTGLQADPHDTASIALAIIRILADEEFASRLGKNGRNHVIEKLTWQRVGAQFEKYLRKASSNKRAG